MYVVLQMWNDVAVFKESLGIHSGLKSKKVQFSQDLLACMNRLLDNLA